MLKTSPKIHPEITYALLEKCRNKKQKPDAQRRADASPKPETRKQQKPEPRLNLADFVKSFERAHPMPYPTNLYELALYLDSQKSNVAYLHSQIYKR